jgi:hypothetical protein
MPLISDSPCPKCRSALVGIMRCSTSVWSTEEEMGVCPTTSNHLRLARR